MTKKKTLKIKLFDILIFFIYLIYFIFEHKDNIFNSFSLALAGLFLSFLFMNGIIGLLSGRMWMHNFPLGKPFSRIMGILQILFALWFLFYL